MSARASSAFARFRAVFDRERRERRERLYAFERASVAFTSERLTMGRYSYGEPLIPTFPGDVSRVTVGAFVSIALDVVIGDGGNHRVDWVSTFPFRAVFELPGAYEDGHPQSRGDVVIGNDVWIGRGARIFSGVTIGDGAVIGGYSIVTKDVRPYAIVAGNPARELRRRFADEQIEALLAIRWWDWPIERILAEVPRLCNADVEGFIRERAAARP